MSSVALKELKYDNIWVILALGYREVLCAM